MAKAFSFITGLLFLNMSFFLFEVTMLKVSNQELMENIAKLITNSGFEEERDGESSNNDTSSKEVDLLSQQIQIHHTSLFLTITRINRILEDHYPHANYSQNFSPPPDQV